MVKFVFDKTDMAKGIQYLCDMDLSRTYLCFCVVWGFVRELCSLEQDLGSIVPGFVSQSREGKSLFIVLK